MKISNLHLNLLRDDERKSSSPIRFRVMVPVLALLLCVGAAVWWVVLFMQLLLLRGQVTALQADLNSKKVAHAAILEEMRLMRDRQAELDQMTAYTHGRRRYGEFLRLLADAVPERIQLTSLEIPEPPPQLLRNPKMPKAPPLLGPTGTVEAVSFRLTGRTAKAAPVSALMESLADPDFKDWIVVDKSPAAPSPRIQPLRQEPAASADGKRLLVFDVEYRSPERRFEK